MTLSEFVTKAVSDIDAGVQQAAVAGGKAVLGPRGIEVEAHVYDQFSMGLVLTTADRSSATLKFTIVRDFSAQ